MIRTHQELIDRLTREGFRFKSFTLTNVGRYACDDADWNYKDVPHFPLIHSRINSILAGVEDRWVVSINLQTVLGLTMPITLFNYEAGERSQTYFTTLGFFVMVIHTCFEPVDDRTTRVDTTYNIGSPRLLSWCFPIIRRMVTKNYEYLMSGDVPMRQRRGRLREWGYSFSKPGPTYSFEKTMNIAVSNVLPPAECAAFESVTFAIDELGGRGERLIGRSDHMGLRIAKSGTQVMVFPRLCPHEGAALDDSACADSKVRCPWHGRVFRPVGTFDLSQPHPQTLETELHRLRLADGVLSIEAWAAVAGTLT